MGKRRPDRNLYRMGDGERTLARLIEIGRAKNDKQRTRDLLQHKRRPMDFMSRRRPRVCSPPHGGKLTPVELGDFLRKGNAKPEHQALRHMIGGLLDG
jgi:hypothetical protein